MTPTDRKSVGDYYLLPAELFLFVGETCGLPRANAVRPYRVLGKLFYDFSAKSITHYAASLFLV